MSLSQGEFTNIGAEPRWYLCKKGDSKEVTNYRPILLLPLISRSLKRVVYKKICIILQCKLHASQFGFLPGKSCCTQILFFINDVSKGLDRNEQFDVNNYFT